VSAALGKTTVDTVVWDFGAVLFRWRPRVLLAASLPSRVKDDISAAHWHEQFFQSFGGDWAEFEVYPKQHHALARRIAEQGALVSEYPIGTGPLAGHFPQRNRIIAGLSRATLVVEAALASGSLITAEQALQMGRDVFAIPGSIHSPQSKGCHTLIRQGAKLVESVEHVLEELQGGTGICVAHAPAPVASDDPGCAVTQALGFDPCSLDDVQARTGLDTPTLQARLLELELDGAVTRLPGGLFQRRVST